MLKFISQIPINSNEKKKNVFPYVPWIPLDSERILNVHKTLEDFG